MFKTLRWIKRNLVLSILISMTIGFLIGLFIDTSFLRSGVSFLTFFMVYPMMVTLNYGSLLEKGNLRLQLITQLVNFIYLPILAYLFGIVFFPDEIYLRLAILLIALLPTSGMTVSWTVMANGNVKEAIRMIVVGLFLGGLLSPFYISFFLGTSIALPLGDIIVQIILVIFIPMLLGFMTQMVLKKRYGETVFVKSIKPKFPLFSTFFVVVLIALVMSLRARMLFEHPLILARILVPVVLGYLVMIVSLHILGRWLFNDSDRIAFVNGTMVRSLSLALAIALSVFSDLGPEIALVIAMAYIVQVQLAAWYTKFNLSLST